jgi:SAM-dependent methyltransferase
MRNLLYNLMINEVTDLCYENCLQYFSPHSRILDVGIGNGTMIQHYHRLIKTKVLQITGIDINRKYLKHCARLINLWQLDDNIKIFPESVENYVPPEQGYFDFILFSMSFMLFKDQLLVLDRIRSWLKPDGKVIFFQTMFKKKSLIMELIKPRLKYVTTIDFGRVTYENDFTSLLERKDISIIEDRLIKKEWFKGEYHFIISSLNGHLNIKRGAGDHKRTVQ